MSEHVKAPQTSIPIKKKLYNLVAVSNHMGGLGGGHYTAYAKNRFTGKWNYFDDSCVSEISEESVVVSLIIVAWVHDYSNSDN